MIEGSSICSRKRHRLPSQIDLTGPHRTNVDLSLGHAGGPQLEAMGAVFDTGGALAWYGVASSGKDG